MSSGREAVPMSRVSDTVIWRIELKVPLDEMQYQNLWSWLIGHCHRLRKSYPDRRVHSVYLDSPELDDYSENVSGVSRRSKVRFRWYDEDAVAMVLEMKIKQGRQSTKRLFRMENKPGLLPYDRQTLHRLVKNNAEVARVLRQKSVVPTLAVSYQRSYYELGDDLRMTIDHDIVYRGLYPHLMSLETRSPVARVVEFKTPVSLQPEMTRILSGMPARVFRHSKYVVGMDVVCGI